MRPEPVWLKDDVVTYPGFLSPEECNKIIDFFEEQGTVSGHWMQTCFYDSLGMALMLTRMLCTDQVLKTSTATTSAGCQRRFVLQ
jgi:hypothetical protein